MIKRGHHIVLLWLLALLACGCVDELGPQQGDTGFKLTVRCDEPVMTRADDPVHKDGVKSFNENLILSVDFLFYPGASPADDIPAVYHIRRERTMEEAEDEKWDITLHLKEDLINTIFPNGNNSQATVYALVNFDASFIGDLSNTSRSELAQRRIVNDFAKEESNYLQPSFKMDGSTTVTYLEENIPECTIDVKRFAAKLTMGIHVTPQVVLRHQAQEDPQKTLPDETWVPVLRTMRLYLVDGVKSARLSADGLDYDTETTKIEYFSYKDDANKRPFLDNHGTPYLSTETLNDVEYYQTWPMYSYPRQWDKTRPDYSLVDYTQSKLPSEAPYFKLELDWRRVEDDYYTFEQRKYYYKIFIPFEELEFKRNSWYGFYLDVAILGTETEEGITILNPSCFLLDWQNKSLAINKAAVISKARYLSVEKSQWEINNLDNLTIPFLSSHDVVVVGRYDPARKPKATRPYYGEITSDHPLNSYHKDFHAWIRDDGKGGYLLDYTNQPSVEDGGDPDYEPAQWLDNTSTSILLDHPLQNGYNDTGVKDFDYSPYTIEFDIVHNDLEEYPTSITYQQYIRHITITQYPGIYIECLHNRDQEIEQIGNDGGGYPNHPGDKPWLNYPWGYVYVNGGRFIRQDPGNKDPYFNLSKAKYKKEYQWQTVYYTGGSKDIYDIHVTVLPSNSDFVIGDPRVDVQENEAEGTNHLKDENKYRDLYIFTVEDGDDNDLAYLTDNFQYQQPGTPYDNNRTRTGFNVATALYGDSPRSLKWYYPTDNGSRTANMLAPSYRISTKLGGTEFGNISKELAEYRCAGYQEDGLPAGRWRLPTKAEVKFIAELSAKKYFIYIFTKGTGTATYWSANGAITVNANNGSVTDSTLPDALLRCVYDSWYWDEVDRREGTITGSDPRHSPTTFYWGDKQR